MNTSLVGVGPGQPSRTSIVVAALRAFGAREPDPSVRNPDFLAQRLISQAELQLIPQHPVSQAFRQDYRTARRNSEVAGMSNLLLIRTRFIDEHMQRAFEAGAQQLVILGAGFDTRPYRFQQLLAGRKVFEVDYRSTQEVKRRRLVEAAIEVPSNVTFVEIDFKTDALHDVLSKTGYQPSQPTFFIWEGVSMYLLEPAVRETLRAISSYSARGSSLVMDFAETAMLKMLNRFPQLSQHDYTTAWGEPWIFGVPDMHEREFFRECGFEVREILSLLGREAEKRYLMRSDGRKFGYARGGPPKKKKFSTMARIIWMFITERSHWYALAKLEKTQA